VFIFSSRELGVDVIEFDCQITKDGKVVVSHDNNLSRLAGVNRLISDLNYNVSLIKIVFFFVRQNYFRLLKKQNKGITSIIRKLLHRTLLNKANQQTRLV